MPLAVERIVVQASKQDKANITAKAKKLGVSVGELMRRSAAAYTTSDDEDDLIILAESAKKAAERASASIEDSLEFIAASNKRIHAMEQDAQAQRGNAL